MNELNAIVLLGYNPGFDWTVIMDQFAECMDLMEENYMTEMEVRY